MPFANVDGARVRWFTNDECARPLNAYPPDFRRLVRAALLTGCRYGELYRLEVGDVSPEAGTLRIRQVKGDGRGAADGVGAGAQARLSPA